MKCWLYAWPVFYELLDKAMAMEMLIADMPANTHQTQWWSKVLYNIAVNRLRYLVTV